MEDGMVAILKWASGGVGLATMIKWLHGRDNRLEDRIIGLERNLVDKVDKGEVRQTIMDLNEPLQRDLNFLKEKMDSQDGKLDKIIEKL